MSREEPVGSLTEEAAKLLAALQGWARDADGAGAGLRSTAAEVLRDLDEHVATGGQECRYCPICQLVAAIRRTSPEVKEHLTAAATSLTAVAASLLDSAARAAAESRADRAGGRRGPVEKIDLTGDDDDWEV